MLDVNQNQTAWDKNAMVWDDSMKDGSPFQKTILEPSTLEFLNIQPGQKVLDIACGNGQMSRVMANLGATVLAVDGSSEMIKLAVARSKGMNITYTVLDVLAPSSLDQFKEDDVDSVLCNMALMDLPEIEPVFKLAHKVLKTAGVFVFSITHPCFDKSLGSHLMETHDRDGVLVREHSIKVQRYLSPRTMVAKALPTLPTTHFHFHRSLETYLKAAFKTGFYLCDISECAFPKDSELTEHKGWHNLSEIPVVLITKLQKK